MIKIGLSGNRYSGKNEVCDIFKQITIPVFEADIVLKFIINHDESVNNEIISKLKCLHGESSPIPSVYIDPKFVKTKAEFDILFDCTQHKLMRAYEDFSEKHKSSIYTIFHSSILFERNWHRLMNYSIAVFCPKITRIERCKEITNMKVSDITTASDLQAVINTDINNNNNTSNVAVEVAPNTMSNVRESKLTKNGKLRKF